MNGDGAAHPRELAHAAFRGAVGAMAMTGMRMCTVDLGIVDETPPQAIFKQKAKGLLALVPRKRRRAAVELAHWSYGAAGGFAFGLLPAGVRRQPWAGPIYGLLTWVGFEAGLAPVLGLAQARQLRLVERAALAGDHLLYGLVLSEGRRQPQENST